MAIEVRIGMVPAMFPSVDSALRWQPRRQRPLTLRICVHEAEVARHD
jgi:hypothetical protein